MKASTRRLAGDYRYVGIIRYGSTIVWSCGHEHSHQRAETRTLTSALECARRELDRRQGDEHVLSHCAHTVIRIAGQKRCENTPVVWCWWFGKLAGFCNLHEQFMLEHLEAHGQYAFVVPAPLANPELSIDTHIAVA